jgi:tetrathionate reductase subunit A
VPIKPGTEGAFALAMIRWIIENRAIRRPIPCQRQQGSSDRKMASRLGATQLGWSNLTHKATRAKFLRAQEIGIAPVQKRKAPDGSEYDYELFVVLKDGKPVAVDPNDEKNPVEGDLFVDTTLQGVDGQAHQSQIGTSVALRIGLRAYPEGVGGHLWRQCRRHRCAWPMSSPRHGKKAARRHPPGCQPTLPTAFYNCFAWNSLNLLIGNYDWKGGIKSKRRSGRDHGRKRREAH